MAMGPWEVRARHIPGSLGFPSLRTALNALGRDDQIILYANDLHRVNTTAATRPRRPDAASGRYADARSAGSTTGLNKGTGWR
jgi:hypothetical protein